MKDAAMTHRAGLYPDNCNYDHSKEFEDIHEISDYVITRVTGAFDDAFIEIEKAPAVDGIDYLLPYYLVLPAQEMNLFAYAEATQFRLHRPFDTVLIIGIDHINNQCVPVETVTPSIPSGMAYAHWIGVQDAFYNWVGVGSLYDYYEIYPLVRYKEGLITKAEQHIAITATHELGHCLLRLGDGAHIQFDHGVMVPWHPTGTRSYFHAGHIMRLRESSKFDSDNY